MKLKDPVLVEGLPGIGNVAKICVDFLREEMRAKHLFTIYSDELPHSVFVTEDSLLELPHVEFSYFKAKRRHVVLLSGTSQATSEKGSYILMKEILKRAKHLGVKEVITLGGIGHAKPPSKPKVHLVATHKEMLRKAQKLDVLVDGSSSVGVIIGAAGLLLGLGKRMGFKGFSLLVDTFSHPSYLGFSEAQMLLKVLKQYLDFEVDERKLKPFQKQFFVKRRKPVKRERLTYIG